MWLLEVARVVMFLLFACCVVVLVDNPQYRLCPTREKEARCAAAVAGASTRALPPSTKNEVVVSWYDEEDIGPWWHCYEFLSTPFNSLVLKHEGCLSRILRAHGKCVQADRLNHKTTNCSDAVSWDSICDDECKGKGSWKGDTICDKSPEDAIEELTFKWKSGERHRVMAIPAIRRAQNHLAF
jgi:hypothetical protein